MVFLGPYGRAGLEPLAVCVCQCGELGAQHFTESVVKTEPNAGMHGHNHNAVCVDACKHMTSLKHDAPNLVALETHCGGLCCAILYSQNVPMLGTKHFVCFCCSSLHPCVLLCSWPRPLLTRTQGSGSRLKKWSTQQGGDRGLM